MTLAAPHPEAPSASALAALVGRPAIVSAFLAPVLFLGGTLAAGLAWPSYNPVSQTISELAAGDAPTRVFMTVVFALTALCHVVTGLFLRGIGPAGRVTLVLAGAATFAVALFPLPTVAGTSVAHRASALTGFILLAIWPVLGMRLRRAVPWIIRPLGAILSTAVLATLCFWFLAVWASPQTGTIGVVERVAADAESLWPAVVVAVLLLFARRAAQRSVKDLL
jgi:hypothetical membrane protein